ncbi:hypothetical protein Z043_102944 [Scleropages formosus]|uniref:Zinc finger protein 318-like n=1 Tax=Scleropages formosus TaxID=113540 RepID=A0A0P7V6B3_SCLFO|nr:hypothetical protein Z043_102944 [Scleropages formosus]
MIGGGAKVITAAGAAAGEGVGGGAKATNIAGVGVVAGVGGGARATPEGGAGVVVAAAVVAAAAAAAAAVVEVGVALAGYTIEARVRFHQRIRKSGDSPVEVRRDQQPSSLSRETERFLQVVSKGMESGLFASMLGERREESQEEQKKLNPMQSPSHQQHEEMLSMVKTETPCEFLLPHERVRQDSSGFSRILGLMGDLPGLQEKKKSFTDIEDEERFLYGDEDEEDKAKAQTPIQTGATQQYSLSEIAEHGDGKPETVRYHDAKSGISQYHDSSDFMLQCLNQDERTHGLPSKSSLASTFPLNHRDHSYIEDHAEAKTIRSSHDQNHFDMRYCHGSQTSTTLEKDGKSEMSCQLSESYCYPPGVGPQDAKERQDIEEYEKIQNLLKTIGLDLGVAEISKIASRTQERLHGKKPAPASSRHVEKQADRRASSASWDRRHSDSRSGSRSRSPSWSHSCKKSSHSERCSQSPPPSRRTSYGEIHMPSGRLEVEEKNLGIPVLGKEASQPPIVTAMNPIHSSLSVPHPATTLGPLPAHQVSTYPQNLPPNYPPLTPNYPPSGYGQYGNYMPYVSQRWPMYPPPSLVPPMAPVENQRVSTVAGRPYLRVIETVTIDDQNKGQTPQKTELSLGSKSVMKEDAHLACSDPNRHVASGQCSRVSEEKNNASQKQKVSEEWEKLKKEREMRMKKKEYLMKELERLRKQQGELLRKKRREKDGHKDPLLAEVGHLQEDVMAQISELRKEHEAAEKKRAELEKVAIILGLHVSEKYRKESRLSVEQEAASEKVREQARTSEKPASAPSTNAPSSKKRIEELPLYEQRRNLDRQAGLAVITESRDRKYSELKRKMEEDPTYHKEERPQNQKEEKSISHKEERSQKSKTEKTIRCKDERIQDHKEERPENHRDEKPVSHRNDISQKKEKEKTDECNEQVLEKASKTEASKLAEQTEKLPDFHRVISGPSPSILAKVRKRNEEAIKSSSSSTSSPPAFGKFSWKKVDKEEEKAPENIMEEESSDVDGGGDKDDGKAALVRSKTIAIKLSGKTVIPPSSPWVPSNSQPALLAKIRPNLPAPPMVLRKSGPGPSNKPPPLNTFLSIRPSGNGINKPLPVLKEQDKQDTMVTPDLISKAFCGEEVVLKTPEVPDETMTVGNSKAAQGTEVDVSVEEAPLPPGMCILTYESDVAVPGVPESEQTVTVVVRPPPMLQKNPADPLQKTEKPKSNLAAAKAQDLYDIFYGSGPSDHRGGARDLKSVDTTKSKDPEVSIPSGEHENDAEAQGAQEFCKEDLSPEVTAEGSK